MAQPEPLPTASTYVKCYMCQRDYSTSEFPVEYNEDGCECCPECGSDFVELVDELPGEAAISSAQSGGGSATSGEAATSPGVPGASASASGTSQRQPVGAPSHPPTAAAHNATDASGGQRSTGLPTRIEFHATFDHRPVHAAAGPLNFVDAISRFAPVNLPNGQQAFVLQVQDGALLSPFTMGLPFGDTLALNPADWVVGDDLDAVVTRLLDAYAPPRRAADQQVRDALPRWRVRPAPRTPPLEQAAAAASDIAAAASAPTLPSAAATGVESATPVAAGVGSAEPGQQQPLVSVHMEVLEAAKEAASPSMNATTDGAAAATGVRMRLSVPESLPVVVPQSSGQQHSPCPGGSPQQPDSTLHPLVSLELRMQQGASDVSAGGEDGGAVTRDDGGGSSEALSVRLQVLDHHHALAAAEDLGGAQQCGGLLKEDGATRNGAAVADVTRKAADARASDANAAGAAAVTAAAAAVGKGEGNEHGNEEGAFASCQPGELCTVCHDVFAAGTEVVELPCRHCFHEDCIMPWLQQQNTCPVCRKRVDEGAGRAGASGSSHNHSHHHRQQQQQQPRQRPETPYEHQHGPQQQPPAQSQSRQPAQESQQQALPHQQFEGLTGFPNFLLHMEPQPGQQPQPPQIRAPRRPIVLGGALDQESRQAAEAALESLRSQFAPLSMRTTPTPPPAAAMHPAAAIAAAAGGPPGALEEVLRSLGLVPGRPQTQGANQAQQAQAAAAFALPAMRAGFLNSPGVNLFGSGVGGGPAPSSGNGGGGTRSALRGGFFNSGGVGGGVAPAGSQRPRGAPFGAAATGGDTTAPRAPRTGSAQEPTSPLPGFAHFTVPLGGTATHATRTAGPRSAAASEPNVPNIFSMLMGLGNRTTGGPAGTGSGGSRAVHMALDPAGLMEMIPCMLWDMALYVVLEHGSPQAMLSNDSAASERRRRGGSGSGGVAVEDAVAWERLLTGMGFPDSDDDSEEDEDDDDPRAAGGGGGRGAGAPGRPPGPLQLQRALRAMGSSSPAAWAASAATAAEAVSRRSAGLRMDEQRRRRALVRLMSRADAAGTPRPSDEQLRELQQRALRGAEHVARASVLPPAIPPVMIRVAALADTWLRQAAEFIRQMPPPTSSSSPSTAPSLGPSVTATPANAPSAVTASSSGATRKGHARGSSSSGARLSTTGGGHSDAGSGSSSAEDEHDEAPTRRVARRTAEQDAATLAHSKDSEKVESKEGAEEAAPDGSSTPADARRISISTRHNAEAAATAAAATGATAAVGAAPGRTGTNGSGTSADVVSGALAARGSESGRSTMQSLRHTSGSSVSCPGRPEGTLLDLGVAEGVGAACDNDTPVPKAGAGTGAGAEGRKVRAVAAAKRSVKATTSSAAGGSSGAVLVPPGAWQLASPRNSRNALTRSGSSATSSPGNSSSGAAAGDGGGGGGGGFNPVSALVGGAGLGLRFLGGVAGALFRRGGAGNGPGNRGA